MIVIDTSVWIDFFRGNKSEKVNQLKLILNSDETIVIPAIIYVEILQGIKEEKRYNKIKSFLDTFKFIPFSDKKTFLKAVKIYRVCRNKGFTIKNTIDCLIASVVTENDFTFLHNDRDFRIINKFFNINELNQSNIIDKMS